MPSRLMSPPGAVTSGMVMPTAGSPSGAWNWRQRAAGDDRRRGGRDGRRRQIRRPVGRPATRAVRQQDRGHGGQQDDPDRDGRQQPAPALLGRLPGTGRLAAGVAGRPGHAAGLRKVTRVRIEQEGGQRQGRQAEDPEDAEPHERTGVVRIARSAGQAREPLEQDVVRGDDRPDRGQGGGVDPRPAVAPPGGQPEDDHERVHRDALVPAQEARLVVRRPPRRTGCRRSPAGRRRRPATARTGPSASVTSASGVPPRVADRAGQAQPAEPEDEGPGDEGEQAVEELDGRRRSSDGWDHVAAAAAMGRTDRSARAVRPQTSSSSPSSPTRCRSSRVSRRSR